MGYLEKKKRNSIANVLELWFSFINLSICDKRVHENKTAAQSRKRELWIQWKWSNGNLYNFLCRLRLHSITDMRDPENKGLRSILDKRVQSASEFLMNTVSNQYIYIYWILNQHVICINYCINISLVVLIYFPMEPRCIQRTDTCEIFFNCRQNTAWFMFSKFCQHPNLTPHDADCTH